MLLTPILPSRCARSLRLAHRVSARCGDGAVRILAAHQSSRDAASPETAPANTMDEPESRSNLAEPKHIPIGASFLLSLIVLGSVHHCDLHFYLLVTYSQATLHFPARVGFIATTGGYVLGIAVIFYGGWLSDRYGRRPVNVWGNLFFLLMIYPAFTWITSTHTAFAFIVSMTLLNGASNFVLGSFLPWWPRACPSRFAAAASPSSTRFPSRPLAGPRSSWSHG